MSQSRAREERRRQRMLYLGPQPTESASENVRLALEMRERANLTGRCVCGAVRELFEVIDGGELRDNPRVRTGAGPGVRCPLRPRARLPGRKP